MAYITVVLLRNVCPMRPLAPLALALVHAIKCLMPSDFQEESLEALLGLFLEAQGHPLPPFVQQSQKVH